MKTLVILSMFSLSLACGGSGSETPPPVEPVPPTAQPDDAHETASPDTDKKVVSRAAEESDESSVVDQEGDSDESSEE